LPRDLAQNLNSATEATLQGTRTIISTGTCTSEDIGVRGNNSLQPRKEVSQKDDLPDETTLPTRVLCSACSISENTICLLCNLNEDEIFLCDEGEESVELMPTVLHTEAQPTNASLEGDIENFKDIVLSLCQKQETPKELLLSEANTWNKKVLTNPRLGLPFQEPEFVDFQDEEDLLWCTPTTRPAIVLNANAAAFRPRRTQRLLEEAGEKSPVIEMTVSENPIQTPKPTKSVSFGHKLSVTAVQDTQTTPADFRRATIVFPLLDDFKAIHNNNSGHHGLDYSYRKLIKRCGSKWANERGEATKVKAALKDFLDACPICQKVRGLKEKVKAKHSFIISRPFLEVSYDFIVFKREDKHGNRYLLVAVDNFLKIVEMKAVKNRDAETVARFLLEIGSRYGPMARLRSDREGAFTGLLIEKLNKERTSLFFLAPMFFLFYLVVGGILGILVNNIFLIPMILFHDQRPMEF
jgi:hypothetical protein